MNNVHFSSKNDEWETPQSFYDELNKEFSFTLDPCCHEYSAKCSQFFTPDSDGLSKSWADHVVFMNPPYGRKIGKWIEKAYNESLKGCVVVCLIPSRTDTSWWHKYCMKGEIRFVEGRLKFINRKLPSWRADGNFKVSPAPFPVAIVIFRPNNQQILGTPYKARNIK